MYTIYTKADYSHRDNLGAYSYLVCENGKIIAEYTKVSKDEGYNGQSLELVAIRQALKQIPSGEEVKVYSTLTYAVGVASGTMRAKKNIELVDDIRRLSASMTAEFEWIGIASGEPHILRCRVLNSNAAGIDFDFLY